MPVARPPRWFVVTACLLVAGCSVDRPGTPAPASTPAESSVPTVTSPVAASPALSALAQLPVKGRAPRTGYAREQFGPAWTDDNDAAGGHNGCDTRNDVLARDLTADVFRPGTRDCVVLTGVLRDPYTGTAISFVRGETTSARIQIDHLVALSDAWQTGAQQLTERQRRTFANDPLELLAVDGPTNQAKGDSDAASWLPPSRGYRCAYVSRQIAVKQRYRLWVTPPERDAMRRVLSSCPHQQLPRT